MVVGVDGSLFMFTPIDPMFMFLHIFHTYAVGSYKNLQDIITEAKDEGLAKLRAAEEYLDFTIICDKQEILDNNYWKLNESKVMAWLRGKYKAIKQKLIDIDYVEPSSVSSYVKVVSETEKDGT